MKKLLICAALILTLSAGTVQAWDYCFYDENYTVTSLWFSIWGAGYLHGEAEYNGFFGAITGVLDGGWAYFAIDYVNSSGLRFYKIQLSTREGETWGVWSDTGEFYDFPHSAHLYPCVPEAIDWGNAQNGTVEDLLGNEQ
jgi:hypothetical protein